MAEFSGAAAKPFLLLAREGGYTNPSVVYMLGVIALERRGTRTAPTPTPARPSTSTPA